MILINKKIEAQNQILTYSVFPYFSLFFFLGNVVSLKYSELFILRD